MLRGTMNSKILLAFFAGAVLASGLVYMAVRNEPAARLGRLASAPVERIYISPEPVPDPPRESAPSQPAPPEVTQPHTVTITAGTILPVRIGETITADHNQPGDTFLATLDKPLIVDGFVIAERGARLEGRIVEAER